MPDKHEVGGSSPLGPTSTESVQPKGRTELVRFLKYLKEFEYFKNLIKELSSNKMFIENRIKKKLN